MNRFLVIMFLLLTTLSTTASVHQEVKAIGEDSFVVTSVLPVEYRESKIKTIQAVGWFSDYLRVCPIYVPGDEDGINRPALVWIVSKENVDTWIFLSPSNIKPWIAIETRCRCNEADANLIRNMNLGLIYLLLDVFLLNDYSREIWFEL